MIYNNSIKKNYILQSILTIANVLIPLVTYPYITRVLLPVGTGKVAFANSVVAYFIMFAQLGIPTYAVKECAAVREDEQALSTKVKELMIICVCTSLFSCLCLYFCVLFVQKLYAEKWLYLILSCSIFLQAIGIEWLFSAIEQYSYITKRSLLFKLISMIAIFILIRKETDYVLYAGISVFSTSASYILNFFYSKKFINLKKTQKLNCKKHFKGILMFFAMTCASTIYLNLDSVMLGFIVGDTEVGLYSTAVKVRTLLLTLITSLGTVVLPRASYYIAQDKMEEFWGLIKKSAEFMFLLSIPLTVYFIIFARPSILLLAGNDFYGSILPMQIIMPTLFLVGASNLTGIQILIPLGKGKIVLISEIVGAIIDFVLNLFLIKKYGAVGAAFTTLLAELFVLLVQLVALRKELKKIFYNIKIIKYLSAIVLAIIGSYWIQFFITNNFVLLVMTALSFFIIYYVVLLIIKETMATQIFRLFISIMKKIFKRKQENAKG